MKFGRLLAAGESLVNGNVTGRYQMRKHIRLPRFISPRNPFAAEATAEESASPAVTAEERGAVVSAVTMSRKPSALATAKKASVAAGRAAGHAAGWTGGAIKHAALWCLDHNPFSAIGKPRLPVLPRFGKPPVQGELSLDKVKVMRGDLAHADLEVVSTGAARTAGWRSLTTRVFGGGAR